jgi:hypothetical protein
MLALPIWFSPASGEKLMNSVSFATVAFAGHVNAGGFYCDCTDGRCGTQNITLSDPAKSDQNDAQGNPDATPDSNLSTMVMILALLVYFGMRV